MTDYIPREAAFNAILKLVPKVDDDGYCWVIRGDAATAIDSIPAADAIEELRRSEAVALENLADEHNRRLALEQKHRWIPVTERLPEGGVCVLVTDGLEVGEGWLTEIINTRGHFMRWCVPMTDIDVDRRPITHWIPMPKAPREGE